MNYSKVIKKLRGKLLVSQQGLADILGVSFLSINRWENNKNNPTYSARRKIKVLCDQNGINMEKEVMEDE